MSHTIVNPEGLHDPVPFGYSHTAAVPAGAELVLVSGQYGSGADGMVVSTDFAEQVQQAFRNLGVALAAHDLDLTHVVQLRTYVVEPDFEKLGIIGQAVGVGCGDTRPPRRSSVSPPSRCPTSCSKWKRSPRAPDAPEITGCRALPTWIRLGWWSAARTSTTQEMRLRPRCRRRPLRVRSPVDSIPARSSRCSAPRATRR